MQAFDVILRLRSRLRDTDYNALRFSDNELLDVICDVCNELIVEFDMGIEKIEVEVKEREVRLPFETIAVLKAEHKGRKIPIKPLRMVLTQEPSYLVLYQKTPESYALNYALNGSLEVWIQKAQFLDDVQDDLSLDTSFLNAIVAGALVRLLQIEANAENLQRAQFYLNTYERELQLLRKRINNAREVKNLTTKYQMV